MPKQINRTTNITIQQKIHTNIVRGGESTRDVFLSRLDETAKQTFGERRKIGWSNKLSNEILSCEQTCTVAIETQLRAFFYILFPFLIDQDKISEERRLIGPKQSISHTKKFQLNKIRRKPSTNKSDQSNCCAPYNPLFPITPSLLPTPTQQ